jgi:hypothetical protein
MVDDLMGEILLEIKDKNDKIIKDLAIKLK